MQHHLIKKIIIFYLEKNFTTNWHDYENNKTQGIKKE
jgi:hypothetical protein